MQLVRKGGDHLGVRRPPGKASGTPHACSEPGGDKEFASLASRRQDSTFRAPSDRGVARSALNLRLLQRHRLDLVVPDHVARVGMELRELPWEVFVRRRGESVFADENVVFDHSKPGHVDATLHSHERP